MQSLSERIGSSPLSTYVYGVMAVVNLTTVVVWYRLSILGRRRLLIVLQLCMPAPEDIVFLYVVVGAPNRNNTERSCIESASNL
jgi:hypothetical protein